ncbi:ABC transporter ATP-binding protein [Ruania halotolerans]|uniref:ABC transporter ATP-binding protein n=1 Tax=Ruania halotolerans TaxID=2897773 RepID=UPI001E4D677F|nr:ABC transporter ATP-binding protein [Ruania halotolerans]UFU06447.1 ABC transporter ATP-binding protein [Ruania halotolerans]
MTTPTPSDTGPAVQFDQVVKEFPGTAAPVRAVDGIDLTINSGEIVAFLGPNGAGKTTALDMALGLTTPTAGTITVLGQAPRRAVAAGRVSAVLQTGGLLRDLTVAETVTLIASTYAEHAGIETVIERAGLTELAGRKVSKCSGGEQQRLRFALALLPDPDLLILDEPTAGMDVTARRDFWETMRAEAASGRTIVFATHYLEEADAFAQRIVMVAGGRIVADGATEDIRARATGRRVSVTFAPGTRAEALSRLETLDAVHAINPDGDRVHLRALDSDTVARAVLDLGGTDLLVTSGSLDDAFTTLTQGATR